MHAIVVHAEFTLTPTMKRTVAVIVTPPFQVLPRFRGDHLVGSVIACPGLPQLDVVETVDQIANLMDARRGSPPEP